jgi:hypothetical protein
MWIFKLLTTNNWWLTAVCALIAILISARLYKYTKGRPLTPHYSDYPVIKAISVVCRDPAIAHQQNSLSLFILLLTTSYILTIGLLFLFFSASVSNLLLLAASVSFALCFALLMTKKCEINKTH